MNIELQNPQTLQFTAECIKESYQLTERVIYNICTGVQSTVPYGFWDYALPFLLVSVMVLLGGVFYRSVKYYN